MTAFLVADGNLPFTTALVLMLAIGALEAVSMLAGATLSGAIENLVPTDLVAEAPDVDGGSLAQLLGWLRVGQVPVLMLLVIFLTAFGLIGLTLQAVVGTVLPFLLPGWVASLPAFVLALPTMRATGGLIARIIPRDETDAVSEESFIGRVATVTLGRATSGSPAQARLRDQHGQTHYVMVEPDEPDETFETGRQVILVRRQGAVFRAIPNTSAALVD
jgi:hypothetical protein